MPKVRHDVGPRRHTICRRFTQARDDKPIAPNGNGSSYDRNDGGSDDDDTVKGAYPKRVFIRARR
jgi:hypothetical protein